MTTKKQRREQVAIRRSQYDAETKRLGLAALKRSRESRNKEITPVSNDNVLSRGK